MNEIRTYPTLFGLESQPNYNTAKLGDLSDIQINRHFNPLPVPTNELEILFGGIGIDIDNISIVDIVQYHTDGLGVQLRKALNSFNEYCDKKLKYKHDIDGITIYDKAELFQGKLKSAMRELTPKKFEKIDKINKNLANTFTIGSVAIGALLPTLLNNTAPQFFAYSLGGAVATITLSLPDKLAEFITKIEVGGFQSKFLANMWTAKRIVGNK